MVSFDIAIASRNKRSFDETGIATKKRLIHLFEGICKNTQFGIDPSLVYHENGDGTVTALTTGLIWANKVFDSNSLHYVGNTYSWSNNNNNGMLDGTLKTDYLDVLNNSNFAGFSDWRIPSQRELQSLIDYNATVNTGHGIDPIFLVSSEASYWSSTIAPVCPLGTSGETVCIWYTKFVAGADDFYGSYRFGSQHSLSAMAVRGGCG